MFKFCVFSCWLYNQAIEKISLILFFQGGEKERNMLSGLYNYLSDIRPTEWFEYAVVLVLVMFVVTRIIRPTWMQLVALGFGLMLIFYRTDRRRSTTDRAYKELKLRLKELYPKPENFHMDADILNFFYNTRDFRKFHSEGYDEALVAVDNMLKIISEMEGGVYHCAENLDIVRDQLNKAMNHYQTIIFKLPSDMVFQRRHKRALNALHVMLRRHVDNMVKLCHVQYASGPREVDRAKINSKAAQFYNAVGYDETGGLTEKTIDIDWHPVYNSGPRPNDLDKAESGRWDFYY